jgi:multisubunit Na+/H+ antiporter MnhE subunit
MGVRGPAFDLCLRAPGQGRRVRVQMAKENARRRAVSWFTVSWFAWWALMMSFWVAIDDSLRTDELIAGAIATALAAAAAVGVGCLAQARYGFKAAWLPAAIAGVIGLPGRVGQETFLVFAALAKTLVPGGEAPRGGFREVPVRYGDDTSAGVTRRILLTGAQSLAPNGFVLDFDAERDVMIVHELVKRP